MAGERTLPGLGLTGFWSPGSDNWDAGMDANLRLLSAVSQLAVISRVTALPGSPTDGDVYLVPDGTPTTGNQLAIRDNGTWVYFAPAEGWRAWVVDEGAAYVYDGTDWVAELPGAGSPELPPYDIDDAGKVLKIASDGLSALWAPDEEGTGGGGGGGGASEFLQARTSLTTSTTIAASTNTIISWDGAAFDDAAYWSAGSPTRLTIPVGVTRAEVVAAVTAQSFLAATTDFIIRILKNGTPILEYIIDNQLWGPPPVTTGVIEVVAGDYFQLEVWVNASMPLNESVCYMSISGRSPTGLEGPEGPPGADGVDGAPGADGADGVGVPAGGTTGQVLAKNSDTDFDTEWVNPPAGGGGGGASAFTDLTDVPASYTGQAGRIPRVKLTEDGIEFDEFPADGSFTVPVNPYSGARCQPTADQNYTTLNAWDTVRFAAADRNPGSAFWSAGNPNRLTVPTGVTKVRLTFSGRVDSSDPIPANNQFTLWKNGSSTTVMGVPLDTIDLDGINTNGLVMISDVLDVTAGDYFEVKYFVNASFTLDAGSNHTWFAMEVVETASVAAYLTGLLDVLLTSPTNGQSLVFDTALAKWKNGSPTVAIPEGTVFNKPFKGAMAKFTSDKAWASFPRNPVSWDATDYDTDGFWSVGSPGRFTIPEGVKMVRLSATIQFQANNFDTGGARMTQLNFLKNGSATFRGNTVTQSRAGSITNYRDGGFSVVSPPIPVVEGDYFDLYFNTDQTGTLTAEADICLFAIEVLETETIV